MYILPKDIYVTRSPNHDLRHRRHVICSATTTTTKPKASPTEPQLVNPPNCGNPPVPNDPSLQSTWSHRAWLAIGCTAVLISLAKAIVGATHSHIWLEPILAGYIGYILADLGSGFYHWGIDNYGNQSTPIFGTQIEAFQGHHKWPWIITRREIANNLNAPARTVALFVLPIALVFDDPIIHGLVAVCSGCTLFCQQFHAWAHAPKSELPALVVALQDVGVLVSRSQHAAHHKPPFNNNYCIVSGVWNKFLDNYKVFETLEMALYLTLGVRPRSWSEPNPEFAEEVETTSEVAIR